MKLICVNSNEAGQRFDKLLAKYLNKASKSFIYKMLRKKNILLNGKKATGNEILALNDEIKIFLSDETYEKFSVYDTTIITEDKKRRLNIVFEDENVIFINKPVGMLSQKAEKEDVSLVEYLLSYLLESNQISKQDLQGFRPSICNRLDRNTSGLVAAGKSLIGLQKLTEYIRNRDVDKYYLTIVSGTIMQPNKIKGYLRKGDNNKVVIASEYDGCDKTQYIETEYTPLSNNDKNTLLKVKLITGKTHQIRAHLASIGNPIIGDYKYGNKKVNDYFKEKYKLHNQLLHSYEMIFCNTDDDVINISNKIFRADLPKMFKNILNGENLNIGTSN